MVELCRHVELSNGGTVELWGCRIVQWWSGGVVESSNGGLVELWGLCSCRIVESLYGGMVSCEVVEMLTR